MIQLDHINMTVKNLKESVEWYQKVFGFELVENGMSSTGKDLAIIRSGESMLCLYEYGDLKHPSTSLDTHKTYHFGFRIKERKQWEEVMEKENVKIHHTWRYPHSFSWYLEDPSGHEIEVVLWDEDAVQFSPIKNIV